MKKIGNPVRTAGKFLSEVKAELKKVSWSSPQELKDATIVVIISTFFLAAFIAVCDFFLNWLLQMLIR